MSNSFVYHDPYAEPGVPIDPYCPRLKLGASPARIALLAKLFTDSGAVLHDLSPPQAQLLAGAKFKA